MAMTPDELTNLSNQLFVNRTNIHNVAVHIATTYPNSRLSAQAIAVIDALDTLEALENLLAEKLAWDINQPETEEQ